MTHEFNTYCPTCLRDGRGSPILAAMTAFHKKSKGVLRSGEIGSCYVVQKAAGRGFLKLAPWGGNYYYVTGEGLNLMEYAGWNTTRVREHLVKEMNW